MKRNQNLSDHENYLSVKDKLTDLSLSVIIVSLFLLLIMPLKASATVYLYADYNIVLTGGGKLRFRQGLSWDYNYPTVTCATGIGPTAWQEGFTWGWRSENCGQDLFYLYNPPKVNKGVAIVQGSTDWVQYLAYPLWPINSVHVYIQLRGYADGTHEIYAGP